MKQMELVAILECYFSNQHIIIRAEVVIMLKVKVSISDAVEESKLSRLCAKFADQIFPRT